MSGEEKDIWRVKWLIVRTGEKCSQDYRDNTNRPYKDKVATLERYAKEGGVTNAVVQHIRETVVSETPIGDTDARSSAGVLAD